MHEEAFAVLGALLKSFLLIAVEQGFRCDVRLLLLWLLLYEFLT